MVGTSAGNGLDADDTFLRNRRGVSAQDKTSSSRSEIWKTSNRKIFVVDGRIVQQNLSGLASGSIGITRLQVTRALTFLTTGNTHGLELSSL